MYQLLVLLSLLASNAYGVIAVTLDASMLNQLGYNNQSYRIYTMDLNITDIDPEAFKGFPLMIELDFFNSPLTKLDLEVFKYSSNLQLLNFQSCKLTQLTNSKKIKVPSLYKLVFFDTPLVSLDSNVIQGLPNLVRFILYWSFQLSPLKPNQLSAWKKLESMCITTKNQTSLTKDHFNGINSLKRLIFLNSNINTIEVHTLLALPNATEIDFGENELKSFEYLQIPPNLEKLNLYSKF